MNTVSNKLQIIQFLETLSQAREALQNICALLTEKVEHCQWAGFYFMNDAGETLHLGPFSGEPTEHVVIPYGRGICGQVARSGQTYRVEEVGKESNYIACSHYTQSEIVVPLYQGKQLIGQIDLDSHTSGAFTDEDQAFLQDLMKMLDEQYGSELEHLRRQIVQETKKPAQDS